MSTVATTIYERMPTLKEEAAFYNKNPILQVLREHLFLDGDLFSSPGSPAQTRRAGLKFDIKEETEEEILAGAAPGGSDDATAKGSNSSSSELSKVPQRDVSTEGVRARLVGLEVASGSGQHAQYFTEQLNNYDSSNGGFLKKSKTLLVIQPSEYDKRQVESVITHVTKVGQGRGEVLPAVLLDVCSRDSWESIPSSSLPDSSPAANLPSVFDEEKPSSPSLPPLFDFAFVTNIVHISSWETTIGLMQGSATKVKKGGYLYIYGPFKKNGQFTTESNARFDLWCKKRDPSFGIRDIQEVADVGSGVWQLEHEVEMPSNNFCLIFRRV